MMPAGTYYIGDLCYVMHDKWDEFCKLTIDGNYCLDGEFNLSNGIRFATYGTAYGDGVYPHSVRGEKALGVDAGLIGCIRIDHINTLDESNDIDSGIVVTFDEPFETSESGGTITFGNIRVYTNFDEVDEEFLEEV